MRQLPETDTTLCFCYHCYYNNANMVDNKRLLIPLRTAKDLHNHIKPGTECYDKLVRSLFLNYFADDSVVYKYYGQIGCNTLTNYFNSYYARVITLY